MPTLRREGKWKLSVYGPGDHPPPHFHIIGPDHDVIVHAVSFQPLGGTLTGVPDELGQNQPGCYPDHVPGPEPARR